MNMSIFVGSVYGAAEELANTLAEQLVQQQHQVTVHCPGSIEDVITAQNILIITSTTGSGDIPSELEGLYLTLNTQLPMLTDIPYGVITLGDSSYGDTFCGSGRKFSHILDELQAKRVIDSLEVDACVDLAPEDKASDWITHYIAATK
jgi:sulfite reductase alpha subunit-like flavoprotein